MGAYMCLLCWNQRRGKKHSTTSIEAATEVKNDCIIGRQIPFNIDR